MQHVAGPELDARIAAIIGDVSTKHKWEQYGGNHYGSGYKCLKCGDVEVTDDIKYDGAGTCIRPYSYDLNAAFAAAEKAGLFDDGAFLEKRGHGLWQVTKYRWSGSLTNPDPIVDEIAQGATPALAICAAVLTLTERRRSGV